MDNVLRKFVVLPYQEYIRNQENLEKQFTGQPVSEQPPVNFKPVPPDINRTESGCNGAVYVAALDHANENPPGSITEPTSDILDSREEATPLKTVIVKRKQKTKIHKKNIPVSKKPRLTDIAKAIQHNKSRDSVAKTEVSLPIESDVSLDTSKVLTQTIKRGDTTKIPELVVPGKEKSTTPGISGQKDTSVRRSSRKLASKRDPDNIYLLTG